ncbi:TonB-dependent receptor [Asticcacaulis sp. SL142]|uniref:TonB-dependent receptor n=1 Tax=Asticcacaulis sp. SL142 TaxID=2995155 RepID=UPI00226C7E4A|nr:TonB-dependent receptor [Asticcacaulis sp. SL142]WAC47672.1 TonB-dependent receptor [Asticcacaulis sp. SL142]
MKFNKSLILASSALAGLFVSNAAMAQSTATQDVEDVKEVVISASKKGVGPINKETGAKTKIVIDQLTISAASAGQTIAETLNVVPGYNFTNNDPYGSSGGDLFLRGLDGSRVSLTVDGVQLNDAGNYAIYTNQQLDGEVLCQASVLTGATDIDSMSASATGGTINFATCKPTKEFGVDLTASVGDFNYSRGFVRVNTGEFGPFGTTAYIAYSQQKYDTFTNDKLINDEGELEKKQINAQIRQDFDNGSFVSLLAHYNENRNHFIFGQSPATFATEGWDYNSISRANINPSDTGNVKWLSKWNLTEKLTITADASFQYVMANGGGTSTVNESTGRIGSWTNANFRNYDLNGDRVISTSNITIHNPNTTQTNRLGLNSSAIYRFNDQHTVRLGVSLDRARTKQTGEGTFVNADGSVLDVFGAKDDDGIGLYGRDGSMYQRRHRFSKANVDVISLEYRGKFMEDNLFLSVGVRSQKLERDLDQRCYSLTTGTGGTAPFCTTQAPATTNATNGTVTFANNTGSFIKPYKANVSFDKVLPNVNVSYKVFGNGQFYASYSESLSSPRTDQYYAVTVNPTTNAIQVANPKPETTKFLEGGFRYNTSMVTFSSAIWARQYKDRIVSSYDTVTDTYFDRNVGEVDMNGWDASLAFSPVEKISFYSGVTYSDSEVKSDTPNGEVTVARGTDTVGTPLFLPTAGKKLVEVPEWMFNYGGSFDITENWHLRLDGKYVGERWATDVNDLKAKRYTTWNASLRYDLPWLKEGTYLQLNAINLFDARYYGNISTQANANAISTPSGTVIKSASTVQYNQGAPRTVMLTLRAAF